MLKYPRKVIKMNGIIEENLITFLKISNHCIQSTKPNKNINQIIKEIIKSLNDKEARVANRLSLSRIPLGLTIPLTAYFTKNELLLLSQISFYAISDFLDGFYSKHVINHPTKGGTYIDAACDKIGAAELILGALYKNPALITNLALEGIISKTNINNTKQGKQVKSTKLGKLKMWPLSLALISTYMSNIGLHTKHLRIEKDTFKTMTNILIPITSAIEILNILEYKNIENETSKENTDNQILNKIKKRKR